MTPTNAQILEGRDEALEHLGISLVDWETFGPKGRRDMLHLHTHDNTDLAAARTVIDATDIEPFWDHEMWSRLWLDLLVKVPLSYPTPCSKPKETP